MRGKRAKQYRKLMQQYQLNFSFREPYQVILDADIIKDAARFKMQLGKMLQNTLHGEIKPMITQCCIRHLYNSPADPSKDDWIEVAKQAERRRCGHHELDEPLSALQCIQSVVDPKENGINKHRYVVAVQDDTVRRKMRSIVGVPLVYIARSVMILEPMAQATENVREREEKAKIRAGLKGRRGASVGEKRKRESDDEDGSGGEDENGATPRQSEDAPKPKKHKARGPKGPNPLSMQKSKKEKEKAKQQADAERAALRKVAKQDPQAAEKAGLMPEVNGEAASEAPKKRRRKRKPKDASAGAENAADSGDED